MLMPPPALHRSSDDAIAAPDAPQQWQLVATVTLIATLAWIDRSIFSLMVIPIQQHFTLTDTQVSVILGPAFTIGTLVILFPAGSLADRMDRRTLIAFAAIIWSVMTISSGLAGNYHQLLLSRMLVGLGEGLLAPASFSLMRDGVSIKRRGRAFSIYSVAATAGGALSMLIGGTLMGLAGYLRDGSTAWIAALEPYQLTLWLIGLIGFPMAVMMWRFPEPARPTATSDSAGNGYAAAFRHMGEHKAFYIPLAIFTTSLAMMSGGFGAWLPTILSRKWELSIQGIGIFYGILMLVLPSIGLMLSGSLIDRMSGLGKAGVMYVALPLTVLVAVVPVVVPIVQSTITMWLVLSIGLFLTTASIAVLPILVGLTAPGELLGKVMAIFGLLQAALAGTLAPTIVALTASGLFSNSQIPLAPALAFVSAIYGVISITALSIIFLRAHSNRKRAHSNFRYL